MSRRGMFGKLLRIRARPLCLPVLTGFDTIGTASRAAELEGL